MLHLLNPESWSVLLAWTSLAVVVVGLLRTYYLNGLNKFPAPGFAAFTNWWRLLVVARRQAHSEYTKLHEKHGDIIRLGPSALSFSDPQAVKVIYGLSNKLRKVCFNMTLSV